MKRSHSPQRPLLVARNSLGMYLCSVDGDKDVNSKSSPCGDYVSSLNTTQGRCPHCKFKLYWLCSSCPASGEYLVPYNQVAAHISSEAHRENARKRIVNMMMDINPSLGDVQNLVKRRVQAWFSGAATSAAIEAPPTTSSDNTDCTSVSQSNFGSVRAVVSSTREDNSQTYPPTNEINETEEDDATTVGVTEEALALTRFGDEVSALGMWDFVCSLIRSANPDTHAPSSTLANNPIVPQNDSLKIVNRYVYGTGNSNEYARVESFDDVVAENFELEIIWPKYSAFSKSFNRDFCRHSVRHNILQANYKTLTTIESSVIMIEMVYRDMIVNSLDSRDLVTRDFVHINSTGKIFKWLSIIIGDRVVPTDSLVNKAAMRPISHLWQNIGKDNNN